MPLSVAKGGRFPWARLQQFPLLLSKLVAKKIFASSVQGLQLALFPLESPSCAPINHAPEVNG